MCQMPNEEQTTISDSLLRPGDVHHADALVEPQGVPDRRRGVDDVVVARRLEVVLVVAAVHRVALVHHLGVHGVAIRRDLDAVAAARHVAEPPCGERHHLLLVAVVGVVALRRAAAVLALLEAVERQHALGARGHRRRAPVLRVLLAVLAAVRVVALLAVAGPAREVAAGAAHAKAEGEHTMWEAESTIRRKVAMVATALAVAIFASLKNEMINLSLCFSYFMCSGLLDALRLFVHEII